MACGCKRREKQLEKTSAGRAVNKVFKAGYTVVKTVRNKVAGKDNGSPGRTVRSDPSADGRNERTNGINKRNSAINEQPSTTQRRAIRIKL